MNFDYYTKFTFFGELLIWDHDFSKCFTFLLAFFFFAIEIFYSYDEKAIFDLLPRSLPDLAKQFSLSIPDSFEVTHSTERLASIKGYQSVSFKLKHFSIVLHISLFFSPPFPFLYFCCVSCLVIIKVNFFIYKWSLYYNSPFFFE